MRWVQLCSSLSILWHCLSLGLEWKPTFSSSVATAEFSKFGGILSAALSQHHLSGFGIAQLEFYQGLECKSRKSRNTCSNRQIWPWNTEWSRAKTNRVLPRKCTGHNKHPLPTTQEKTIHGYHQMVNTKIRLIIFFASKDGEALYSQQKQDQELTVAQTMNSLLPNSDWNWRK